MNLFVKTTGEIARMGGRTLLLRLRKQYSMNQCASFLKKSAVSLQSRKLANVSGIWSQQHRNVNIKTETEEEPIDDIMAENPYAQRFFENSIHYANTIIPSKPAKVFINDEQVQQLYSMDWDTATEQQVVHGLKLLSQIERTAENQEIFLKILDRIRKDCCNYQDNSMVEMLKGLVHVQHNGFKFPISEGLHRCLDKECLKRFMKSSLQDKLLICYILHYLHISKHFAFTHAALLKIGYKPQKLSAKNLVQLLYIISVSRKAPINMYELEYRLEQCKEELSITELGIAVLGFFKTRTQIKSLNLFNYIVQEAVNFSNTMDSVTLSAITKMIRYNMQLQALLKVSSVMLMLKPRIADVHLMTVTHIAETYVTLNFHRIDALRQIAKRLKEDIKVARIKDIERMCMCLCHFHYTEDTSIYDTIIKEINERVNAPEVTDTETFPGSLPRILASLAQIGIYPHSLIQHVMSEAYIQELCNGNYNKLNYCYCYLHYSIQIDDPTYKGPFLNRLALNVQAKSLEFTKSSILMHKPAKQLSEVLYYCKEVVNEPDAVYVEQFLPHYPIRDILIGIDSNKKPIPIVSTLSRIPITTLKRVHEYLPENAKLVVLVMGSNQLRMRGTAPVGSLLLAKIRHLKRVGCTPYIIWNEDWIRRDDETRRKVLLEELLFSDHVPEQCQ